MVTEIKSAVFNDKSRCLLDVMKDKIRRSKMFRKCDVKVFSGSSLMMFKKVIFRNISIKDYFNWMERTTQKNTKRDHIA